MSGQRDEGKSSNTEVTETIPRATVCLEIRPCTSIRVRDLCVEALYVMLTFLTLSILIAVAYLAIVATITIVAALRTGGRRNDDNEDHQALALSRFTIPVSIIVPVPKPSAAVRRTVASLLELNYPEFEVIVVVEGQSGIVLKLLARDFQLE